MEFKLIDFEPNKRDKQGLLRVLSEQKGYTRQMFKADALALDLCTRCGMGQGSYKLGTHRHCQDCKDDLSS